MGHLFDLTDLYFYCRGHHRQLWSTIARMNDGDIINTGFDIDPIKKFIIESMDDVDMVVTGSCFACAYAEMIDLDRTCEVCPITQNVGRCSGSDLGCGNVWIAFIEMYNNYHDGIINLDNVAIYCDYFRDLALKMVKAW